MNECTTDACAQACAAAAPLPAVAAYGAYSDCVFCDGCQTACEVTDC
ncbi:hypothetical protein DB32_005436 [Sandaracinus amylolyticus]|uniref:Uncharacterized protein n=1 Tax=Sandaracinus amylolyticus TaxID=927083 RepID=A0A0F6W5V9_9BACT|nr:hypothetical protein DB32_005436 [Sandaracinus amylolyticus]